MSGTPDNYLEDNCLICEAQQLVEVKGFSSLQRITSDCKPFSSGGRLSICLHCGSVQKIPDRNWLDEISVIYADYAAYSIADGEEQLVLDPETGALQERSMVLVRHLQKTGHLPSETCELDVGCGHGVTLKQFAQAYPQWKLFGHELGGGKRKQLEKILGFQRLYSGDFSNIDEKFGFISMIHSLEHFDDPVGVLKSLRELLEADGKLFIQVCNVDENPFDILIADHLLHFSPNSLAFALQRAGYSPLRVETGWVRKEISLLAECDGDFNEGTSLEPPQDAQEVYQKVSNTVSWLNDVVASATNTAANAEAAPFAIFGTSIAGTWLAAQLGDQVQYFVDEDPNRVGREYMGKPVVRPADLPRGAVVFLALAPKLAELIERKLTGLDLGVMVVSPGSQ